MGNTHSVRSVLPEKPPTVKYLVSQFISEVVRDDYPSDDIESLEEFSALLVAKCPGIDECRDSLLYFRSLEKGEKFRLLKGAIFLARQTEQIWQLNVKTLDFFITLQERNRVAYGELLEQLKMMCKRKLFLKAHQLDTLVASLKLQMELPTSIFSSVELFLAETRVDYKEALQALRLTHGPELDAAALKSQKLHHAVPHALEIKTRTMLVLNRLGFFPSDNASYEFLKSIISFMIEFHDYEQTDLSSFKSFEEATAARILTWLDSALHLEEDSSLRPLLSFIANRIIVLGTTMVFSPIQTCDLAELYFLIEATAERADIVTVNRSNKALTKTLEAAMLITGVCDKNPASLYSLVETQHRDALVSTLGLLTDYTKSTLLLEFFNSAAFTPYFKYAPPCRAIDIQAFFITLAPHLSMRAELLAKGKPELVNALIEFIAKSRCMYLTLAKEDFIGWYDEEFSRRFMNMVIHELFFSSLPSEVEFSRSQIAGLHSVYKRLVLNKTLPEREDSPLIEHEVPERDAVNIMALSDFYKGLVSDKQQALISELVLGVIVQAGFIYSHQADLGYYNVIKPEIEKPTVMARCRLFTPSTLREVPAVLPGSSVEAQRL
jgi:hypothetical protein